VSWLANPTQEIATELAKQIVQISVLTEGHIEEELGKAADVPKSRIFYQLLRLSLQLPQVGALAEVLVQSGILVKEFVAHHALVLGWPFQDQLLNIAHVVFVVQAVVFGDVHVQGH